MTSGEAIREKMGIWDRASCKVEKCGGVCLRTYNGYLSCIFVPLNTIEVEARGALAARSKQSCMSMLDSHKCALRLYLASASLHASV